MGLDMTLCGAIEAPADSKIAKVIEEHLTDEDREHVGDIEWSGDGSTYIGGWDFSLHPLYKPLCLEMGYTPHEGSPHFDLLPLGDVRHGSPWTAQRGWIVKPVVYYWRKANAIHQWFVEKCQDGIDECQESPVHPEMLMDLLERLDEVHLDPEKARLLLPTQGGFFFGGTDYDEWYFRDLQETATGLRAQVALLMPLAPKFYYRASW